jgi:hypothetical protein
MNLRDPMNAARRMFSDPLTVPMIGGLLTQAGGALKQAAGGLPRQDKAAQYRSVPPQPQAPAGNPPAVAQATPPAPGTAPEPTPVAAEPPSPQMVYDTEFRRQIRERFQRQRALGNR